MKLDVLHGDLRTAAASSSAAGLGRLLGASTSTATPVIVVVAATPGAHEGECEAGDQQRKPLSH
jgi:hypothetical protein